jgi:hypothetical protein
MVQAAAGVSPAGHLAVAVAVASETTIKVYIRSSTKLSLSSHDMIMTLIN